MADRLSRAHFLGTGAAALSAFAALPRASRAAATSSTFGRVARALVLSGGGARGAYEAGIIDYLAASQRIPDGRPLAPYGIVCGTSIGALNGYFVATGQYTGLRDIWYRLPDEAPVRLKPQFAKITNPAAGLGTRVVEALRMAVGLTRRSTGVLDGQRLRAWMSRHIDPQRPVVMPFVWTVTNLTKQSPEFFYLVPKALKFSEQKVAVAALRATVGPTAVLREATPDLLVDALRASAAIPVAFSSVMLPDESGRLQAYVDGGVTANTPVGVARAAAHAVDVIMLDPQFESAAYQNALDIGYAVFGAMQRRILESDIRAAYFETYVKRALHSAGSNQALADLENSLYASDFFIVRPKKELPVDLFGFDERQKLFDTYKLGFAAVVDGFPPYHFGMFGLHPQSE